MASYGLGSLPHPVDLGLGGVDDGHEDGDKVRKKGAGAAGGVDLRKPPVLQRSEQRHQQLQVSCDRSQPAGPLVIRHADRGRGRRISVWALLIFGFLERFLERSISCRPLPTWTPGGTYTSVRSMRNCSTIIHTCGTTAGGGFTCGRSSLGGKFEQAAGEAREDG